MTNFSLLRLWACRALLGLWFCAWAVSPLGASAHDFNRDAGTPSRAGLHNLCAALYLTGLSQSRDSGHFISDANWNTSQAAQRGYSSLRAQSLATALNSFFLKENDRADLNNSGDLENYWMQRFEETMMQQGFSVVPLDSATVLLQMNGENLVSLSLALNSSTYDSTRSELLIGIARQLVHWGVLYVD